MPGVPLQATDQGRTTGEAYLLYLRNIVEFFDLQIETYEKVNNILTQKDGFLLETQGLSQNRRFLCKRLIIAKGDMDQPNWLDIPGETLSHVSHYFNDPHPYFRKRLLIVGGRNSAAEAALRCWRAGAEVAVSYRRSQFSDRVKHFILPDLQAQIDNGNIVFYPETVPIEITPKHVVLQKTKNGQLSSGPKLTHNADFVLICTGFRADMALFEMAGVNLIGPKRKPELDPDTMESNVPGLYVAGTAVAGMLQDNYRIFIENSHDHVDKIVVALTGKHPSRLGGLHSRNYELSLKEIEAN